MDKLGINVSESLGNLCRRNGECALQLQGLLAKQIWSPTDRQSLLASLAKLLLHPSCTVDVIRAFRTLSLELVSLAKKHVQHGGKDSHNHSRHQQFCLALSKIIPITPEIKGFALSYLSETVPLYHKDTSSEPPVKKSKKGKVTHLSDLELVQATHHLLCQLETLGYIWDWSEFCGYLGSREPITRWYTVLIIAKLTRMSPASKKTFQRRYFTEEEIVQLSVKCDESISESVEKALLLTNPSPTSSSAPTHGGPQTHTMREIVDQDLSKDVTCVCGVVLLKLNTGVAERNADELVAVASTQRNLRCLALAVAAGSPVLLEGPVGCGKTSLVEHLARVTGRGASPHLTKIQLGDQTDSKALLGTYRCTEVPGEFVWQPGALTAAVRRGHWVLLEDLDYAPMDVVSLLLPLLESRMLSVPGHGGQVTAHPDFRVFATLRLLSSGCGYHRQHSTGTSVLDKLWTRVNVEPLSRAELQQVITVRYPQLAAVPEKLLDIYFLLSSGKHEMSGDGSHGDSNQGDETDEVRKFLSQDGRLISTRDLMKWCGRIAVDFDGSQATTASAVFEEALDCFCASISKPDKSYALAEAIAAKLNITKAKAEYYCDKHKPSIELTVSRVTVGRVSLQKQLAEHASVQRSGVCSFAFTRQAVRLLERVAVAISRNEPVLLVGETGTGKTSSVQYLAQQLGHTLRVVNMNQQSDSTDLLGGFKPVDMRYVVAPFREEFELAFCKTFSRKQNGKFLSHIQECFLKHRWKDLFKLMQHTTKAALKRTQDDEELHKEWMLLIKRLKQLSAQVKQSENVLAFSFIEGTLVRALRRGDWVLLDEINLATAETLECLSGLLESTTGSIVLLERGDTVPIVRHPDFRLFACMNPATDVGKKDLPPGVRNRFTELYMSELEDSTDLKILVAEYLKGLSLTAAQVDGIVKFYLTIRSEASKKLIDGTGHKPCYSLRTLCRALQYSAGNPCGNVPRSLYEGFCLSFLTQLDRSSHPVVQQLVCQLVLGRQTAKSLLKQSLPEPPNNTHCNFEGYWIAVGTKDPHTPDSYVLTPTVRENLRDLARVVSARKHPVLLQGETSVGKTSLITWLAQASGNVCLRINNHEHTDIQEYVGCYSADESGKLVFRDGVLVEAMRQGFWIILDELNLAPTDVLEALNRLLDDNRELFIAETQEVVKAHPRFMLFATQNPPGQYGGRKILSRAFRNRFVELHFSELPSLEVETILHQRCGLPLSYSKKLVAVMVDLQTRRRSSGVFAGKQGYITLRDLFRWAERYRQASDLTTEKFFDWDQLLADNGYMLLAGRVRRDEEADVIRDVIKKHLKRTVAPDNLFSMHEQTSPTTRALLETVTMDTPEEYSHVVWTQSMRRMAVLVGQALAFGEAVLLVGETGCGKTTICQLFASQRAQTLHSVNCHMHTESADFLGGLRPVRQHSNEDDDDIKKLFEWCDGPLIQAMRDGTMFLVDEISLADDSVLERLNSVLETDRTLLLAEKGGGDGGQNEVDVVVAKDTFRIVATMNPGGDFGKKELSPALRNRFTEIWCPLSRNHDDMVAIMRHNLHPSIELGQAGVTEIASAIVRYVDWFSNNDVGKRCTVSIRDLLTWVNFINIMCARKPGESDATMETESEITMDTDSEVIHLDPAVAFIHGACMVFLDSLGSGVTSSANSASPSRARESCVAFLLRLLAGLSGREYTLGELGLATDGTGQLSAYSVPEGHFGIAPFSIPRGPRLEAEVSHYALDAPTTCQNAQRVLRALQLTRPILLEGSPGVGKTSLVAAIARSAGHELVRINLSEQTDVSDLFGADLPVEGGEGGQFSWRDGPLLRALKAGHWVVLDELNLASQSVLEGLNACLDHRAEVYIPELGRTFHVQHDKTRLFACQNPLHQGGGRKGLPRSFLNRFTQVYVEPLSKADLMFIAGTLYPRLPTAMLESMVDFNQTVCEETCVGSQWGQRGGPFEFNLRDLFRWCDLLTANQIPDQYDPGEYMALIYSDRMRTMADKSKMRDIYADIFGSPSYQSTGLVTITNQLVRVGHSFLPRKDTVSAEVDRSLSLLHHSLGPLESLMKCLEMNWMSILVGPSAAGKTSIVQLLSQVCGQQLDVLPMNTSMDTTELLGGFEQMDLHRHLDELVRKVDEVRRRTLTEMLVSEEQHRAHTERIMSKWHKYCQIRSDDTDLTTSEEVENLQCHLEALEEIINLLIKVSKKFNLSSQAASHELKSPLRHLAELAEKCKTARQGGTFEWIDSLLVSALQHGHWLLIDNVNFCSPSVLDRLNALLEPNGVLTINERGVIDGQLPTIMPHPDFRLVLSMNAKHGEISRAMRNRGVEIYVPGEEDGAPYDDQDIRSLFRGLGLIGRRPAEILMSLHQSVSEQTSGLVSFSVTDLLQVALLCVQQMERGLDVGAAMYNSAVEVYVRSCRDNHVKQALSQLVVEHLHDVDLAEDEQTSQNSALVELGLWPDRLPSAAAWCDDVTMATAQQHTALLLHFLNQFSVNHDGRSKMSLTYTQLKGLTPEGQTTPDIDDKPQPDFNTAIKLVLERTPINAWQTTVHFLNQVIPTRLGKRNKKALISSEEQQAHELDSLCQKTLEGVFQHPLMDELQKLIEDSFGKSGLSEWRELPFDLRWNKEFFARLRRSKSLHGREPDETDNTHRIFDICNQMYVVALLAQSSHQHTDRLQTLEQVPKRREASLLELSCAVHKGLVERDHLPDPCVVHLYPLVSNLDSDLRDMFSVNWELDDQKTEEVLQALQKYKWFVEFCQTPLRSVHKDVMLPTLSLLWGWLYEGLLEQLLQNDRLSGVTITIVSQLQSTLSSNSQAAMLHDSIAEDLGRPRPFPTPLAARLILRARSLSQVLALGGRDAVQRSKVKVKLALLQGVGQKVKAQLVRVVHRLWTEEVIAIEDWTTTQLNEAESILMEHGLLESLHGTSVPMETCQDKERPATPNPEPTTVALLPFYDFSAVAMEMQVLSSLMSEGSYGRDDVERWLDFTLEKTSICPHLLDNWRIVHEHTNSAQLPAEIQPELLLQLLHTLSSCTATNNPQTWLSWKPVDTLQLGVVSVTSSAPQGPAMLFTPLLSHYCFVLHTCHTDISDPSKDKTRRSPKDDSENGLPSNVPLGKTAERLTQLQHVNRVMLENSNNMALGLSHSEQSVRLVMTALQRLLQALVPSVPDSHKGAAREILLALDGSTEDILSAATCLKHLDVSRFSILLPEIEDIFHLLSKAAADLQRTNTKKSSVCHHTEMFEIGQVWAYTGLLQGFLLAPKGPVDPAHRLAIQLDHMQAEVRLAEEEMEVRSQHHQMLTGQDLPIDGSTHPMITSLLRTCRHNQEWVDAHINAVATRPLPPQFHLLLQEVRQFLSSLGAGSRILSLARDLQQAFESVPHHTGKVLSCVREYRAWVNTAQEFIRKMESQFPFYRDLILPFLVGIQQIEYGISVMGQAFEAKTKADEIQTDCDQPASLSQVLEPLCRFPFVSEHCPSSLHVAQTLLSAITKETLEHVATQNLHESLSLSSVQRRLLSCALHHARNHLSVTLTLDGTALQVLSQLFHVYVGAWHRDEEARRSREEERAALYRYRAQTHGDELTSEERDEREREQQFPTFEQEFEDITVGFTLDDKPKHSKKSTSLDSQPAGDEEDDEIAAVHLTEKEMSTVSHFHQAVFTNLTKTLWHSGDKRPLEAQLNYSEAVVSGYQVAAPVGASLSWICEQHLDMALLGGHLMVNKAIQDSASVSVVTDKKNSRPYDVYHEPNVPEAVKCRPLLERFNKRVLGLLEEWSDHPTLKQILEIIKRVLGFPITSPLMKFVTGLEILLQKAQEWESNAARHVSLSDHMEATTALIIEYRKLELSCWQSCLDAVQWKARDKASKWWFHIYQLLESFLQPGPGNSQSEALEGPTNDRSEAGKAEPRAEGAESKPADLAGLREALKQYMEGSTLGEYTTRLGVLEAFHYQVVHMDASPQQEKIQNLLWNLHAHYQQFVGNVIDQITKLRSPIEKQLKGFVKIARWNDINYYAVKQAVERTHKTLHKHMKEFETILSRAVAPVLTEDVKPDWSSKEAEGSSLDRLNVELFTCATADTNTKVSVETGTSSELQQRLTSLSPRFTKHCVRVMSSSKQSNLAVSLDEFTGEVIESVHDLQSLDVTQTEDKEKQRSEARYIQQRKRKALSDLFKYLNNLGLSHRKGLVQLSSEKYDPNLWTLTTPVDVSTALKQLPSNSCDTEMATRWQGCDKYYRRCLSRHILLHTALRSPSQELGLGNIERCKGFSQHLMQLVSAQRTQLAEICTKFVHLRKSTVALSQVKEKSPVPHSEVSKWKTTLSGLCDQTQEGLQQVSLVLECCPVHSPDGSTGLMSPFPQRIQCRALSDSDQGQAMDRTKTALSDLAQKIKDVNVKIEENADSETISTRHTVNLLGESFSTLIQISAALATILTDFRLGESETTHPLVESLVYLRSRIERHSGEFRGWQDGVTTWEGYHGDGEQQQARLEDFSEKTDSMITELLLIVQKFVQKAKENRVKDGVDDDEALLEKHLTKHMHEDISSRINTLNLNKVTSQLSDLLSTIAAWSDSESNYPASLTAARLLTTCLPLLEQYCRLAQFTLTELVSAHRTTAKLLSVLLALFTELTQKGFCLPAEFSDEVEGEGATDFKDIEGGGIGEGSGAKDVSDQIETEDQLEDTRRQGEEDREEEDQRQEPDVAPEDNAIEMSEQFDGKMHDLDAEGEEGSDSDDEDDENDLDREMGDLEGAEADKLDEQIWGSDEEEEEQKEDDKDEFGPGAGQQTETELVAKDDNQDKSQPENNKDKQENKEQELSEEKTRELEAMDESEYNENEADPYYNEDQSQETEPQNVELPEDLALDDKEGGTSDEEAESQDDNNEENAHDIDKMKEQAEEEPQQDDTAQIGPEDSVDKDGNDVAPEEGQDPEQNCRDEPMEVDDEQKEDEASSDPMTNQEPGFEPKPEEETPDEDKPPEGVPQDALHSGKTEHDTANVQESDQAQNAAGQNDEKEKEGTGMAETEQDQGHQGQTSTSVTRGSSQQQKTQRSDRQPGQASEDRSTGSSQDKVDRRLQTMESETSEQEQREQGDQPEKSDLYEHIKQSDSHYDTQTLDVATAEQQQDQAVTNQEQEQAEEPQQGDDVTMEDTTKVKEETKMEELKSAKQKKPSTRPGDDSSLEAQLDTEQDVRVDGSRVPTLGAQRGNESTIHTQLDHDLKPTEVDIEKLRAELEEGLTTWTGPKHVDPHEAELAQEAWSKYEALTSGLSQELCEQLRLVLEPTQASKLRGDFRTGKRLNMRKVIPYIASQFRKDKIWLRRTKPSKRQYQVMVAVDDSSSMADNHSKQLAFESLSVIANALSLLEVGELAISSFGESVKLLHPFHEQFTSQSGARILQQFTFEQKKTKIAQLLGQVTSVMMDARSRQHSVQTSLETSQLLLVVSDGRGLFLEGSEVVKSAVRRAREANVFLVFVVIDNPDNKDSILDIKVPVFKGSGQLPEIKSYMDSFPFPFYIILRDINSLPHTLSDALRQWFELVTASDR